MERINDPVEADAKAREYVVTRHPNAMRIFFNKTFVEEDSWIVHGEFWIRRIHFFVARRYFRLRIKAKTSEVMSYEEKRHLATV